MSHWPDLGLVQTAARTEAVISSRDIPANMRWLPRLQSGLVVPYIAAWTSERGKAKIEPERRLGGQLALTTGGKLGDGEAMLGIMNWQREREVALERRCQVCRRLLGKRIFFTIVSAQMRMGHVMLVEPPTCKPCMEYAAARCPGIRRAKAQVWRCTDYTPVSVFVRMLGDPEIDKDIFDPLTVADFPPQGVVGHIKMIPIGAELWAG